MPSLNSAHEQTDESLDEPYKEARIINGVHIEISYVKREDMYYLYLPQVGGAGNFIKISSDRETAEAVFHKAKEAAILTGNAEKVSESMSKYCVPLQ